MNKIVKYLAFAVVAILSLTFVSCSSDDDEEQSIVGTWKMDLSDFLDLSDYGFEVKGYLYYQFNNDGTFRTVDVTITKYSQEKKELGYEDETEVEVEKGRYTTNGNIITIKRDDGTTEEAEYKISGNKLTLSNTSGLVFQVVFTRVSESEMNQYLNSK